MKTPLQLGLDPRHIEPEVLSIITNDEIISWNQDPLGVQGRKVATFNSTLGVLATDVVLAPCIFAASGGDSAQHPLKHRQVFLYSEEDATIRTEDGRCLSVVGGADAVAVGDRAQVVAAPCQHATKTEYEVAWKDSVPPAKMQGPINVQPCSSGSGISDIITDRMSEGLLWQWQQPSSKTRPNTIDGGMFRLAKAAGHPKQGLCLTAVHGTARHSFNNMLDAKTCDADNTRQRWMWNGNATFETAARPIVTAMNATERSAIWTAAQTACPAIGPCCVDVRSFACCSPPFLLLLKSRRLSTADCADQWTLNDSRDYIAGLRLLAQLRVEAA
eukprot:SAG31_NODE_1916_length_6929_cov_4.013324_7_plen_330_part_00